MIGARDNACAYIISLLGEPHLNVGGTLLHLSFAWQKECDLFLAQDLISRQKVKYA
jgi:hypothetical protein